LNAGNKLHLLLQML